MDKVSSFNLLQQYIEKESFKGYDPYDTLTGWFPFHWFGKWGPVLAIQFQKRNPVNIRPLLGVKKDYNPKAMGLLLHACSLLYQKTNKEEYKEKATFIYNWLKNNTSKGYRGSGWGYNFPWAGPSKYLKPFVPSAVVTGFVCRGLLEYYKIVASEDVKRIINDAADFIKNELPRTADETGICISYTPVKKDVCFNASLLGAEVLAINYFLNGNQEDAEIAIDAVRFVIHRQKTNGLWAYSVGPDGKERIQTDFHQGYVIESIFRIKKIFDKLHPLSSWTEERKSWIFAIKKGCKYYYEEQFESNGRSFWRLPKKWPVDIHNQAQGIITFHVLKEICPDYQKFADTIANWTIENMQHPKKGYFYYRIFKSHTHKIPYMRWSQAWMFLALSYLIDN